MSRKSFDPGVIDAIMAEEVPGRLPGALLQVKRGDELLYRRAYGYARLFDYKLKPLARPVFLSERHIFDVASLSKVFATSFALMLLVDSGRLGLNEPVCRYFPEFADKEKKNILISHLLGHRSGLKAWFPFYLLANSPAERYRLLAGLPLSYRPGQERLYSDLGFILLADLVRLRSGQPLDRFLLNELYQPLGLTDIVFNPKQNGIATQRIVATSHGNPYEEKMCRQGGYVYNNSKLSPDSFAAFRDYTLIGEVSDANAWHVEQGVAGHAGLFAGIDSLQLLLELLMNGGEYQGRRFLSPATCAAFSGGEGKGEAYGWQTDPKLLAAEGCPLPVFGHLGFTGCSVLFWPKTRLSIILLTNRQHAGLSKDGEYYNLRPLRQRLVDAIHAK